MSTQNMTANCAANESETSRGKLSKTVQQDIYGYSSLRRALTKSQSSSSLSAIQGLKFEDSYGCAQPGPPRLKSQSRENLVIRNGGRATVGHEPAVRERLPSFTVRQPVSATELQTHFAVYKFVPRHEEEVALNVGDPVSVTKIHEDLWCEGRNLKSGGHGIFPSRYVSDILSHTGAKLELSENGVQFFLRFLGSVEVFEFKGNAVLCQAMAKILSMRNSGKSHEIRPCTLEIDYNGIRLVDHAQENEKRHSKSFVGRFFSTEQKASSAKFFFKLKDVTFCGCYPNAPRYFGFVTKHPYEHRFACHTFMSEYSTEPVAKAIGQAFKRLSAEFTKRSSSR